jgi:hypothetical protein
VTEGGLPVASTSVKLSRGSALSRLVQFATVKTDANGNWKFSGRIVKTTYFAAASSMAEHDYAAGCTSPVAPAGCVSAKLSPWTKTSATVVIKVAKKKK